MKKIFAALLAMSVTLFSPTTALAETGAYLLDACLEIEKNISDPTHIDVKEGHCYGFTQGVYQTVWALNQQVKLVNACLPEGVTKGQPARVVLKYLKDHPAELHQPDYFLAIMAYVNAFPCEN